MQKNLNEQIDYKNRPTVVVDYCKLIKTEQTDISIVHYTQQGRVDWMQYSTSTVLEWLQYSTVLARLQYSTVLARLQYSTVLFRLQYSRVLDWLQYSTVLDRLSSPHSSPVIPSLGSCSYQESQQLESLYCTLLYYTVL